jgi:hypothetical protein
MVIGSEAINATYSIPKSLSSFFVSYPAGNPPDYVSFVVLYINTVFNQNLFTKMDILKFAFRDASRRKVLILKNDEIVEIFIPAVGFFSRFTMLSLIFLIFPVCLINFFTVSLPKFDIKWMAPVLTFNFVISLVAIGVIVLSGFGQKRLSITRHKISWSYEIFGWKLKDPFPTSVQKVIRIAKTQQSPNRWFLEIWAGRRLYEISTSDFSPFAVTNSEIDLLAKELNDWLGLTILQNWN